MCLIGALDCISTLLIRSRVDHFVMDHYDFERISHFSVVSDAITIMFVHSEGSALGLQLLLMIH